MKKVFLILSVFLFVLGISGCASTKFSAMKASGITIPIDLSVNAHSISLSKRNISKGETRQTSQILLFDYKKDKMVDNFVNPGDEYEYKLFYVSQQGVVKEEKFTIVAESGVGEVIFTKQPVGSFDSESCIFSFTEEPDITAEVKEFLEANTTTTYKLTYGLKEKPGQHKRVIVDLIVSGETNCANAIIENVGSKNAPLYYDKPLELLDYEMFFYIDGCLFNIDGKAETLTSVPKEIVIKDQRFDLTVKATPKGNVIILPDFDLNNPNFPEYVQVDRYNDKGIDEPYQISSVYKGVKEITDYFVEEGKSYMYEVSIRSNGKIVKNSKKSDYVTAIGGKGPVTFSNLNSHYDKKTGIMTFDNFSCITDLLDKMEGTDKKIEKIEFWYDCKDNEKLWGMVDLDKNIIDWPAMIDSYVERGGRLNKDMLTNSPLNLYIGILIFKIDNQGFLVNVLRDDLLKNNNKIEDPLIILK